MTNMAVAIANEMGLCNEDIEITFVAAAMLILFCNIMNEWMDLDTPMA